VAGLIYLSVPFWCDMRKPVRNKVFRSYYGTDDEKVWGVSNLHSHQALPRSKVPHSLCPHWDYSKHSQMIPHCCKIKSCLIVHDQTLITYSDISDRDSKRLPVYIGSVEWEVYVNPT
jgi:hypothetical protein